MKRASFHLEFPWNSPRSFVHIWISYVMLYCASVVGPIVANPGSPAT